MKSAATLILLVFVAASVMYLVAGGRGGAEDVATEAISPGPSPTATTSIPGKDAAAARVAKMTPADGLAAAETAEAETDGHHVVVYYFHRTQRCRTCLTMEAYAKDALERSYPEQFKSGQLEWRLVDIDTPANEHFVQDYQLTSNALVMVRSDEQKPAEWKSLDQIWELIGDEGKFKAYVRDEAQAYLEDLP